MISVFPSIAAAGILLGFIKGYGTGAVYAPTTEPALRLSRMREFGWCRRIVREHDRAPGTVDDVRSETRSGSSDFAVRTAVPCAGSHGLRVLLPHPRDFARPLLDQRPTGRDRDGLRRAKMYTPCSVTVKRDRNVIVSFEKEGCEKTVVRAVPSISGVAVIVAGLLDHVSGAAYELQPNPLRALLICPSDQ